jgi:1-deoxy-D-xylulose-5-phosphate reductoisomerase
VLLANKEALVMSGEIMMQAALPEIIMHVLLPVDSRHNAIFRSLPRGGPNIEGVMNDPSWGS